MGKKVKGNGEGTLYKSSKTGLYVGQYVTNNKRHSVYQKKNEKIGDFKKRFNDILSSIHQGTYVEKSNETFEQICKIYIEQKYTNGLVSERTYNRDLSTLTQIKKTCSFYSMAIQKITIEDIETSKKNMRIYSNSVISKMWGLIKKTFSVAYSLEKINKNIMLNDFLTKPISTIEDKHIEALSIKEESKLISILNNQEKKHNYRNIILLQLYTGMRIGEVLALSKDCIDLENNTITVYRTLTLDKNNKFILGNHTKTYKRNTNIDKGKRTFPMTDKVKELIKEILKNKIINLYNLLFYDYKNNTFITRTEINSYLTRINKKYCICKKSLHSHRLRHTFITRCFEKGINLKTIQSIVGHANGSSITLDVYTTISYEFIKTELQKLI